MFSFTRRQKPYSESEEIPADPPITYRYLMKPELIETNVLISLSYIISFAQQVMRKNQNTGQRFMFVVYGNGVRVIKYFTTKDFLYLRSKIIFVSDIIDHTAVVWQGTIVKISAAAQLSNPQEVGLLTPMSFL